MNMKTNVDYGEQILFYVRRINDLMANLLNAKIKEKELTVSQTEILIYLYRNKMKNISVTQRDIENFFGLSHPTIIGILKRMQCKGFVNVTVNEEDKRQRDVRLTEKALSFASEMKSYLCFNNDIISCSITAEQQRVLVELLKIIYMGIKTKNEQ